jgi:hypothetical protein
MTAGDRWEDKPNRHAYCDAEIARLRADLAEMTACRDAALRQAQHADQSLGEVDLAGLVGDGLAALGREWDSVPPDTPPGWLIDAVVGLVRPVVAHAVKRAEQAEAELAQWRHVFGGTAELEATRARLARLAEAEAAIEQVTAVLRLFASADDHSDLFWRVYGRNIRLYANVSDVFEWGTADLEEITPERLPDLQRAYDDLVAIDATEWLATLFAARIRQMRPQGAAYPDNPVVRVLLDECGPERDVGLMNPRAPAGLSAAGGSEEEDPSPPDHDPATVRPGKPPRTITDHDLPGGAV